VIFGPSPDDVAQIHLPCGLPEGSFSVLQRELREATPPGIVKCSPGPEKEFLFGPFCFFTRKPYASKRFSYCRPR